MSCYRDEVLRAIEKNYPNHVTNWTRARDLWLAGKVMVELKGRTEFDNILFCIRKYREGERG